MTRPVFLCGLILALALSFFLPARAVSITKEAHNVAYVIGYRPLHSKQHPFLGEMHLNFNNGIISGQYTDISTRPGGPLANAHNVPVSGGLSSGGNVSLHIRQVTFRGTLKGTAMSGSATIGGSIYEFEAHQGSPGKP